MKEKMKILDLFSGIGGFSLGLESTGHFETTAFCEIDKFCKLILNKHWKGKKIYDDVKAITKEKFKEDGIDFPDIITGGFPCQPFSVAGKQQGTSDSRHLWPEMFRIIKDFSPRWVIGENVKGLTNIQDGMVFETVCSDLEGEGYEVRTFNIPAAGVQAPHRRERLWIVAHAKRFNERESIRGSDETQNKIQEEHRQNNSTSRESSRTSSIRETDNGHENLENSRRTLRQGGELQRENGNETRERNANIDQRSSGTSESNVADTSSKRLEGQLRSKLQGTREGSTNSSETMVDSSTGRCASQETEVQPGRYSAFDPSWWQSEPNVGRVANGVQGRVHRLKSLGNSIIPKIVQEIGNAIITAEKEKELEDISDRNGF